MEEKCAFNNEPIGRPRQVYIGETVRPFVSLIKDSMFILRTTSCLLDKKAACLVLKNS